MTLYYDVAVELDEIVLATKVHIRFQQRNSRSYITTIEGLPSDLDYRKVLRALKTGLNCSGCTRKDSGDLTIIQLSGDQRERVRNFLIDQELSNDQSIIVHGA